MIARFFKKKESAPQPQKEAKTEKPKAAAHERILTAEGWKRMMIRNARFKKS